MLASEADDDALHGIGQSLIEAFEMTHSHDWVDGLLVLYERGPCAMCRSSVVKHLISLDALPQHIAHECVFDADPGTREAAREFLARLG